MTNIIFSYESKLRLIQNRAFNKCNLRTISIPASVEKIGEFAFELCKKLSHIDIPINSELKTIERCAFSNSLIEDIYIPSNLTELKDGWCKNIKYLNKITVNQDNKCYIIYEGKYLLGRSSLEKENYDVLFFCIRDIEKAKIPDFIEVINSSAFEFCQKLEEVEISANSKLHIIGNDAFNCTSIKSIYIPSNLTEIKKYAFFSCENLQNCEILNDSNLKAIESYAFSCSSIDKITIPPNLQEIGEYAFFSCLNLKCVSIPENSDLKIIKHNANSIVHQLKAFLFLLI